MREGWPLRIRLLPLFLRRWVDRDAFLYGTIVGFDKRKGNRLSLTCLLALNVSWFLGRMSALTTSTAGMVYHERK